MNNDASTGRRRRARETALQVLFQKEFVPELDIASSLAYFREHLELDENAWEYAEKLLQGIQEHREDIDAQITAKSRNWKISRMASVDISVLRIGVFELQFGDHDVPAKVALNEAIELAKKYGGTDSPQFINGVLDEVLRSLPTRGEP